MIGIEQVSLVPQMNVLNLQPPHLLRHFLARHPSHFLGLWRYPHWSLLCRSFSFCCSSSWVLLECVNTVEYSASAAHHLGGDVPAKNAKEGSEGATADMLAGNIKENPISWPKTIVYIVFNG